MLTQMFSEMISTCLHYCKCALWHVNTYQEELQCPPFGSSSSISFSYHIVSTAISLATPDDSALCTCIYKFHDHLYSACTSTTQHTPDSGTLYGTHCSVCLGKYLDTLQLTKLICCVNMCRQKEHLKHTLCYSTYCIHVSICTLSGCITLFFFVLNHVRF